MILIMARIIAQEKMNPEGFGYFFALSLNKTVANLDESL
jgi:hypothetical protein